MANQNDAILLCDLGGTHARFARFNGAGAYDLYQKYRLDQFTVFDDIVQAYYDETALSFQSARFSTARTAVDGVIQYARFSGDPIERIDFNQIEDRFHWAKGTIPYLNDLEAGAYGLQSLTTDQIQTIIPAKGPTWNNHKILISIGTGAGHAAIMNGVVIKTPGGHFLPVTVTDKHRQVESFIRSQKDESSPLIMEDFVSGRGLKMIAEFITGDNYDDYAPKDFISVLENNPDAVGLFFEFLGLYAHTVTSVMGFYGGVYLTGGVIDHLIQNNLTNWPAFESMFKPVETVQNRMDSAGVHYVLDDELPLLGLTYL